MRLQRINSRLVLTGDFARNLEDSNLFTQGLLLGVCLFLALFGGGCGEDSEPVTSLSDPEENELTAAPTPTPLPTFCSQNTGIYCDENVYDRNFTIDLPQFQGSHGFLQYDITGIYMQGGAIDHGVLFVTDLTDKAANGVKFYGNNWFYVKGLDTFSSNFDAGAWAIKSRAQGSDNGSSFSSQGNYFNPDTTYRIRAEWGNRLIKVFIDGRLINSLELQRDLKFNGANFQFNTTPRGGLEPPYPGAAKLTNILIGQ